MEQFTAQAATIRGRQSRGRGQSPIREALLRAALNWGAHLLGAEAAANYILRRGEENVVADQHIGTIRPSLFEVVRDISSGKREAKRPFIWRWRDVVIVAHAFRHTHDGYFAFQGVNRPQTKHFALLEIYMRVVEDAFRTYDRIEFVRDQQYLLSRRTVVAQLRPNDLLYQALRRIQKYVNWRRSAFVLAPSLEPTDPIVLHIAAERLVGVHSVSARVGRSFELARALIPKMSESRIVPTLGELRNGDGWTHLLAHAIQSQEGLPRDLSRARSALIVPVPGTATKDRPPVVIVLTDHAANYFTEDDRRMVEEFFVDVGPLLLRSTNMSSIMLHLGRPPDSPSIPAGNDQDPDRLEALPEVMVDRSTPSQFAVDSLQVVQFRQGSISRVRQGSVTPLSFSAAEQHEGTKRQHERPDFRLRRGLNRTKRITNAADVLWTALTERREVAVKDERGLATSRFGNIFGPIARGDSFRSAFVVPIEVDDDLAGLLIAYRLSASEFTDIDKMLLRTVAALLGDRIQFRRHVADHTRLALCVSAIATARTEARARYELVHGARALLNADHAFLMEETYPIEDQKAITPVAHSWKRGEMTVPSLPITQGITGKVFATGKSLAVDDVSQSDDFRPLHDGQGEVVPIVSEVAVPLTAPLSQTAGTVETFGVIDVFWHLPHKISPHELEMLELLGRHAGAVLQLARSLYGAEYRGRSLEDLLGHVKLLEAAASEQTVHEWLQTFVDPMIESDLMIVWSQRSRGAPVEARRVFGRTADEHRDALSKPRPSDGWIGSVFERYRNAGRRSLAIDRYDQPFIDRKQIEGTQQEKHQASIAFCLRPYLRSTTRSNRDVVWAIAVYRFSPRNFDDREKIVLSLAGGAAAAALQRIDYTANETRTLELANVSETLYALISDPHRERASIIAEIAKTLHQELGAHSISIVLYTNPGDLPTRHTWPPNVSVGTPPARPSGLSECVRKRGRLLQFERNSPPANLVDAVATSDFLIEHPEIGFIIAVPLIDDREFIGVLYVNLERTSGCTPIELSFVERLARMIVQCGRIGPTLARMRTEIFERLKLLRDPSQVPSAVLEVALSEVTREIRNRDSQNIELVGNLFLLNVDRSGPRLRQRACIGEASGHFPTVQSVNKGVVGQVARTGEPVLLGDTKKTSDYVAYFRDRMSSELAIPIKFYDSGAPTPPSVAPDVIGVLNLESPTGNVFTDSHKRLLLDFVRVPISSLLHLAESHKLILQNQQKQIDTMVKDASILFLHDFKGAIVAIGSAAAAMRQKLPSIDLQQLNGLLETIESQWDRVERTAASGFPYLTTGAYKQLKSENVLEHLVQWAEQQTPPVKVNLPKTVRDFFIARAHPLLLTNILANLYKNSIAAKRDDGDTPRVSVDCVVRDGERRGEFLDVYFRDNGRGIPGPPTSWPLLFHILKPREEEGDGWGIGLPISRHMMQLMDGDLDVESSVPNEGTTMHLEFRLADT